MSERYWQRVLAPFVPSPPKVVNAMLNIADTKQGDLVYDLGCGDGRFLFASVRPPYNAKAVGIELHRGRAKSVRTCVSESDFAHKIEVVQGDILDYCIDDADVVVVYLTPGGNEAIRPMLEDQLKSGTRVVSHDFEIRNWKPTDVRKVYAPFLSCGPLIQHIIYLYEIDRI
jgi:precorrin-6B methylase 2